MGILPANRPLGEEELLHRTSDNIVKPRLILRAANTAVLEAGNMQRDLV